MAKFIRRCPALVEVSLPSLFSFDARSLMDVFARSCPKLRALEITEMDVDNFDYEAAPGHYDPLTISLDGKPNI